MKSYTEKTSFHLKIFGNQNTKEKKTIHYCFFILKLYANVGFFYLFVLCLRTKEFTPIHQFSSYQTGLIHTMLQRAFNSSEKYFIRKLSS